MLLGKKKKKCLSIPSLLRILISNEGWFFFKLLISLSGDQMVFILWPTGMRHYTNSCSSIQYFSSVPFWNKPNKWVVFLLKSRAKISNPNTPSPINKAKRTEFFINRKSQLPLEHGLTGFSSQIFLGILFKKSMTTQVSNGVIPLLTLNLTLFFLQSSTYRKTHENCNILFSLFKKEEWFWDLCIKDFLFYSSLIVELTGF